MRLWEYFLSVERIEKRWFSRLKTVASVGFSGFWGLEIRDRGLRRISPQNIFLIEYSFGRFERVSGTEAGAEILRERLPRERGFIQFSLPFCYLIPRYLLASQIARASLDERYVYILFLVFFL